MCVNCKSNEYNTSPPPYDILSHHDFYSCGRFGENYSVFNSSPPSAAYMRQWTGLSLIHAMACRCVIVSWTLGNKFLWNLNRISIILSQENVFENVVCQNGGNFVQEVMRSLYPIWLSILATPITVTSSAVCWTLLIISWMAICDNYNRLLLLLFAFNSVTPERCGSSLEIMNFKRITIKQWFVHLPWYCSQVNATKSYQ